LLWAGNNPYTFSHYPRESMDISKRAAFAALSQAERAELKSIGANEAAADDWFLRKASEYIQTRPLTTLVNAFGKIAATFGWLPSPRKGYWPNLVHALAYGAVMMLGLLGMWIYRHDWREHLIFYALFISFVAVTALFFGHTSHRAHLDVYWIVFAAAALRNLGAMTIDSIGYPRLPPGGRNLPDTNRTSSIAISTETKHSLGV
jgi:hypothetical protein